jgi:FMN-dependent NADH-azoreductase
VSWIDRPDEFVENTQASSNPGSNTPLLPQSSVTGLRYVAWTADGATGLAVGTRAILLRASGGVFTEGPWKPCDTAEPYLRQILRFIGIEDVQTARAEGMNIPTLAGRAISRGEEAIEQLAL